MKLGVRAHDFGRMEPGELSAAIAGAGFEAAQLAFTKAITGISTFSDVTAALLEQTRRAFHDNRVEISVLGCYVEPSLPDRDARLGEVGKFLLGLEHAKALGAGLVGTETTNFPVNPEAEPLREAAYRNLKDSVLRMVERAESLGVDIGIEPVAVHTLNSAELTKRLLDEVGSPRLKVIFDPVNLLVTEEDAARQEEIYRGLLDAVGDRIAVMHIKDAVFEDGKKVWRNIGRGVALYEQVFHWLLAQKPDIPLLREEVRPESCGIDLEEMKRLSGLRV